MPDFANRTASPKVVDGCEKQSLHQLLIHLELAGLDP